MISNTSVRASIGNGKSVKKHFDHRNSQIQLGKLTQTLEAVIVRRELGCRLQGHSKTDLCNSDNTSDELLRREVAQDVNFPKEYDIYLNRNVRDQVLVLWVVIVLMRKSYRIVRLVQLHISTGIGPDMLFSLKSLQET